MDLIGAAFVIGGGSGIGKACALAFARFGVRSLIVADINSEAANAVVSECQKVASSPGLSAEAVSIDVTSEDSVNSVVKHATRKLGRIDYCVNTAGIGVKIANQVAEADAAEFDRMLKVNVTGTFLITRAVSAAMKMQEPVSLRPGLPECGTTRGSIVILGSASAFVATPSMVQYTTAKHALLGLTKNAALDNAPHGIRVNSVCPSWVDTDMVRKAMADVPGLAEMIRDKVPMGRIAQADEVADAVMFFCSPLSSYATGCNMVLDGGTTLSAGR